LIALIYFAILQPVHSPTYKKVGIVLFYFPRLTSTTFEEL